MLRINGNRSVLAWCETKFPTHVNGDHARWRIWAWLAQVAEVAEVRLDGLARLRALVPVRYRDDR